MNYTLTNSVKFAYEYNKSMVDNIVRNSFQLTANDQISQVERELIDAFELSLKETELQIIGSVISFGSTARNTHIEDDLDIDIAANLDLVSAKNLEASIGVQERLKQNIRNNLHKRIKFGEFAYSGKVKNRPIYKITLERIVQAGHSPKVKKVDLVLNLLPYINIGLVNQRLIIRQLKKIEGDIGSTAKDELLSQIRFTKWLFHQEHSLTNVCRNIKVKQFERIRAKRGLRSIHIEQIILQLSQVDRTGKFTRIGSFDSLMALIYGIDLDYRKSLPKTQKEKIIPLKRARNTPALKGLSRSEAIQELKNISQEKIVLDYTSKMNENIFDDLRSVSKWNLLVRIARDYFEDFDFAEKYLQNLNRTSPKST